MLDLGKLFGRLRKAVPEAAVVAIIAPEPARKPAEKQWQTVEQILGGAIGSADTVRRLQQAASRQIDSSSYALSQLMRELSTVMTFPARPSAVVIPVRAAQPALPVQSTLARKSRAVA